MAGRRTITTSATVAVAILCFAAGVYAVSHLNGRLTSDLDAGGTAKAQGSDPAAARTTASSGMLSVELNDKQMASVKVEPVGEYVFPAKVGDEVKKGQTLFTIDSPDLLAADSNLIAAAGVLDLLNRNLVRLRKLYETRAVSQHDLDQGISDQQTAEGALRAGRDAVRIFGKNEAEIDMIVRDRKADPTLVVPSPINGRVTARVAAPGLFVQPGNAPAPYSVADISTMWMLANVAESDVPAYRLGQQVKVSLLAYPGKEFAGRIVTIDSMVDPNTHRMMMRSEIDDPNHELRSGMFANFVIQTGDPVRSLAVPLNGVVREGDGTMTVWVTSDRRRFTQRTVKTGIQKDGYRQILEGLQAGELVASDGAIFLSFMVTIGQG
jgi:membrane fusion protein, heavy metal efflux system